MSAMVSLIMEPIMLYTKSITKCTVMRHTLPYTILYTMPLCTIQLLSTTMCQFTMSLLLLRKL